MPLEPKTFTIKNEMPIGADVPERTLQVNLTTVGDDHVTSVENIKPQETRTYNANDYTVTVGHVEGHVPSEEASVAPAPYAPASGPGVGGSPADDTNDHGGAVADAPADVA